MAVGDYIDPQERLRYWQRLLRLQDWDIELRVVRRHELDDAYGRCSTWSAVGRAKIRLLDPQDFEPTIDPRDRDIKVTLVHELLHLRIPADQADGSSSLGQEQAVERIAQALVHLRRPV